MDLAESLQKEKVVKNAPGTEDVKPSDEEKAAIVEQLLTKGVYKETVELPELGISITFRTRSTEEEYEIKQRFEVGGIPQVTSDFFFKLGLFSLVYSLDAYNGSPIMTGKDFDTRLKQLTKKLPAPIVGRIIQEFFKFERKVLLALNPDFLETASESSPSSEQE